MRFVIQWHYNSALIFKQARQVIIQSQNIITADIGSQGIAAGSSMVADIHASLRGYFAFPNDSDRVTANLNKIVVKLV